MGKQRNKGLPPEVTKLPQPLIITQERYYKLITPLFGGGAVTGEPDVVTVIRGTEIRGHLRFWWRACFGGRYKDVKEMKEEEDRIWGAAAKTEKEKEGKQNVEVDKQPEAVQIMVEVLHRGTPVEPFPIITAEEYARRKRKEKSKRNNWESPYNQISGIPSYAAFMFQLSSEEKSQKKRPDGRFVYRDVEFKLTISFPKMVQKDIEGALWAWETFGGIGARTRRGFGALHLIKIDGEENTDLPDTSNAVQWIREHIIALQTTSVPPVKDKAPKNIPCLLPNMKIESITPSKDAPLAWEAIVGELSRFRQVPDGRASQYAASEWPEADTIGGWYPLPTPTIDRKGSSPSSIMPQKFPRAAFGLPIIFNFMKRSDLQKRPLQGKDKTHERLASPLLLRPLLCKPDEIGNTAIGLAIVLENFSFPPEGIVFIGGKDEEPHTVNPYITEKEAKRVKPLQGQPDVLKAFMNYLKGK